MMFSKLIRSAVIAGALAAGFAVPSASNAAVVVGITVGFPPPALPVYAQPVIPGPGYLWNPGYWAYGPDGYYWVPGVWVEPPAVGLLWTPPYWGFEGGVYGFHPGYWGPHVGFYGGINYGFGFTGVGFVGGHWAGGVFAYNTAVLNVGVGFHGNTYVDRTVIVNNNFNHAAFNGPGGIQARPTAQEMAYAHENHVGPTPMQQSHYQAAQANRANFASANGGHPPTAAFSRPGSTAGAVAARGAMPSRPSAASPAARAEAPANRPAAAENRPAAQPAARPQAQPAARPAQPAARPQPQARPQSRPAPREEPKGKPPAR